MGQYAKRRLEDVNQRRAAEWLQSSDDLPHLRRILSAFARAASCSVPVVQHLLAPDVAVAFVYVLGMAPLLAFTDKGAPSLRVLCSHESFGVKDELSPQYNALGSLLVLNHQIQKPTDEVRDFLAGVHEEIHSEVLSTIVSSKACTAKIFNVLTWELQELCTSSPAI